MKSYDQLTSQYLASKGLKQCWIADQLGVRKLHLLNDSQISALQRKGVTVHGSQEGV